MTFARQRMTPSCTISQLARCVGGTLRGDGATVINGVADVSEARPDQATWVAGEKYAEAIQRSRAGVVLVPSGFDETPMPAILCDRLEPAVAAMLDFFAPPPSRPEPGIHPTAVVHPSARIGELPAVGPHVVIDADAIIGARCTLHAGVFLGRGSSLGDDCELWPNVVIRDGCRLGNRVVIHPNSVIGADGFGYYFADARHNKYPHGGGVLIHDDVEIGACSCVDRAKVGDTVIGRGTKIDNLVQVAHNCRIGDHCVLAGQTGISGSVRAGNGCVFGARAGIFDNVAIGDRATIAGCSVVTKDIEPGVTALGYPAQDIRSEMRERAALRRLPDWFDKIKSLIERVERLEKSAHHHP